MPDEAIELTNKIGKKLAMGGFSRQKPGFIYVIGDEVCGEIIIGQDGTICGCDFYPLDGGRKEFIKEHKGSRFYPATRGASDDLDEVENMCPDSVEFFVNAPIEFPFYSSYDTPMKSRSTGLSFMAASLQRKSNW